MATNEILPFASTNTGTNLLTQAEYAADAQRTIGHQPGIARSKLENKALRQASLMSAGLAEFIADYQANNVTDGLTPQQIADYLLAALVSAIPVPVEVPPGAVAYFARSVAPAGYLKANGAAVSRTTYADLFAAIGTTFGAGNGSTTFNVPDLRAEFLRGLDDGRGIDTGRGLGTSQAQAIQNHNHPLIGFLMQSTPPSGGMFGLNGGVGSYNDTNFINATGGAETRPRNIALLACIKY